MQNQTSINAPKGGLLEAAFYARHFRLLILTLFASGTLLLVASAFTGKGGDIIVGDGIGYFEYARALTIEGHFPSHPNHFTCGVSMIGIIGYAPSIWLSRAAGWMDAPRAAQGWALFNQIAFCLPLIALALAGFGANLRTLELLGAESDMARFCLLIWLAGTNICYYVFKDAAMSESATYSTLSFYYWFLIRNWKKCAQADAAPATVKSRAPVGGWIAAGLMLGLAGAIRQQNILHCVALAMLAARLPGQRWRGDFKHALGQWFRATIPAAVAAAAIFVIPYVVWRSGGRSVQIYSYGRESFGFLHPHFLSVLFRPRKHGLFIWTPMYALAAWGWVYFARRHRALRAPLLAVAALEYWLIASWHNYSFGSSVGQRGFFTILPILLFGLPELGAAAGRRGLERAFAALLFALTIANLMLLIAVSTGHLSVAVFIDPKS